jgi:hypothetical protein
MPGTEWIVMGALEIILLIGVAGLWTAVTIVVASAIKAQRTLGKLEASVERLQRDVSALLPRIGSTLESFDRTGRELTRTAGSITTAVEVLNREGTRSTAFGMIKYLPMVLGVARTVAPLFSRRKK